MGFFSDPREDKFHHMSKQLYCVKPEGQDVVAPLLQHLQLLSPEMCPVSDRAQAGSSVVLLLHNGLRHQRKTIPPRSQVESIINRKSHYYQ